MTGKVSKYEVGHTELLLTIEGKRGAYALLPYCTISSLVLINLEDIVSFVKF
jgi:hypothetical protein